MKLLIVLAVLLGSLTYDVRCEGSGDFDYDDEDNAVLTKEETGADGDEDGIEIPAVETGADGDENDEDQDGDYEGDYDYEIICDHFNLELCLHDYENHDVFSELSRDDPLCWESYATADCMHSFAKACFPDGDTKEEFLCKLNNFKDRITVLCLNDSYEAEEELSEEEILECLEGAEVDTEECVEETVSQIRNIIEENKAHIDLNNADSVKCLVMSKVLECTVSRVADKCPEEVADGFKEGAEEALKEIMGDNCQIQTVPEIRIRK